MAATTVPRSHSRESSIPDFDFNPSFSFPAQPAARPGRRSPIQFAGNEPGAFPSRRGSVPSIGTIAAVPASTRPRSSQADALKQLSANSKQLDDRVSGPPSPDYTTTSSSRVRPTGRTVGDGVLLTVLNATVRSHNREASELLQVPMLEPRVEETTTGPPPIQKRAAPPPPGVNLRKGHAHRRSGAISSSDVWSLMNQSAPPLPAPSAKVATTEQANPEPSRLSPGASPKLNSINAEQPPKTPNSFVSDAPSERSTRVCFTESVQIIPRPISIATGSSTSTARRHSVAGSVTSVVARNSPPPPLIIDTTVTRTPSPTRRPHNRTRSNSQTFAQPTAALRAQSDRAQSDRPSTAGAILASPQVTQAPELDIPEVPSLKRPASNSPFMNENTSPSKPPSKKAHKKSQSDFSPLMMSSEFGSTSDGNGDKKKKGKKQIRGWADNILGKKGKRKSKKSKRAPTPPVSRSAEDLTPRENEWVATSWNESYVIMPIDATPLPAIPVSGCPSSPVIDLDAALGPFDAPMESHTGFAAARRRMHSAASRGSGSFFHRRSESLPEMELFALEEDEDRSMEDVFEEEEDDNDCSTSEEESSDSEDEEEEEGQFGGGDGLGIGIQTEDGWPNKTEAVHVSHIIDADHKRLSNGTITAVAVSTDNAPMQDKHTIVRTSSRRKTAPADIITPQSSTENMTTSAATFKPSFIGPALDSPSTFVTAASSPNTPIQHEFSCSDSSYSLDPYRLGEPGPEMRMSVDDIPSLTSSSSNMTMNATYLGMPSTPGANEVLPSSITTVASKEKKEKGKRWSRVWGFWKSK